MQDSNTVKASVKTWQEMTKDERALESHRKKQEAITKVKTGDFPAGIRIKVGEHTLTLKPSGVSEKGSVSYSLSPTILELGEKRVRINKVSFSVLVEDTDLSLDGVEGGGVFL